MLDFGTIQALVEQLLILRDRVAYLERIETYNGVIDLGGNTLTVTGDTTLGGSPAPANAKYIVQTANSTLTAEQALDSLATGVLLNNGSTGVLSIATGSDLPSHTHSG